MAGGGQLRLIYKVTASQTPGQYTNLANVEALVGRPPAGPASALVTVRQSILLEEDFNSGIDRWTPYLHYHRLQPGQWYWDSTAGVDGSGGLVHNCCNGDKVAGDALMMYLGEGAEDWTDYRVEAWIKYTGGVDDDGNDVPGGGSPIGLWVRGHFHDSEREGQWFTGYYVVVRGKSIDDVHWMRLAQLQTATDCFEGACDNPQNQYSFQNPMVLTESPDLQGAFEHNRWYKLTVEVRGDNIKVWLDDEMVLDYTDSFEPFLTGTVGFKTHLSKNAYFDNITVTQLP